MERIDSILILIIVSFVLMGFGFNHRANAWGIGILSLGILSMLSVLYYKLHITFN